MPGRSDWPRTVAAAIAGFVLGAGTVAAGALLLYAGEGFLTSAGFLIALAVFSVAAGLWVGAPDGPAPGHRRMIGRWMLAVAALVVASFAASWWLRDATLQATRFGPPLAMVLLLAEPAYALGALLAALEARRRGWCAGAARGRVSGRVGGVAVPALVGVAVGAVAATGWLIPTFPPGPVFLGGGLLLAMVGSAEMSLAGDPKEGTMRDRVAVVTGVGGRGQIGYAVAEALVAAGARVVVTGRSSSVEAHSRELGAAAGVAADLTDPAEAARVVEAAAERWGRLDVLVNVAGGLRTMKPLAETEVDEWERELSANARTAFVMTRAALPLLRESRGAVVNFASPAGERPMKGLGAYSAAKAGVVALTRALALEERGNGVRVNAVAPGMVDTEQNREAVDDPDAVRWATRDQVVSVVLFLAGTAASGVTGQVVGVPGDGGRGTDNGGDG